MHRLLRARLFAFRPGHELLRVRHLAFSLAAGLLRPLDFLPCADRRSLGTQHLALRTGHELLRARHLAFRPVCPDASVLSTSRPALPADCSALTALRCASYGLLHAWHLALAPVTNCSVLDTWRFVVSRERLRNPHLASCVDLGLLRAQHLVLPDGASGKSVQIHKVKPLELT